MNFLVNDKNLILVHSSMERVTFAEDINIMLTPQFYTIKREPIPVKYAYQAKRIAPSLFDGLLDDRENYEYLVWREDDDWLFLAYNIDMIGVFLEKKGFILNNISKVFFAQQSQPLFVKPLLMGDNEALVTIDKSVVVVPMMALGDYVGEPLVFDSSFTPKNSVSLRSSASSIFSQKESIFLGMIFLILGAIFLVEGVRGGSSSLQEEQALEELLASHPSLQSSYTRDSIMAKYKTLDRVERKKRDFVKKVSNMIFKGVTLTSIDIDNKKLSANFVCNNASTAKKLKSLAKDEQLKTTLQNSTLKVEDTL